MFSTSDDGGAKMVHSQRSNKSLATSEPQKTSKLGAASTPLPDDALASDRSKLVSLELVQSIDQACDELVLNKEQVVSTNVCLS